MSSSISDPIDYSTIVYSVVYVLIVYGGFPDKCGGGANPVRGITRMDASIASLNTQTESQNLNMGVKTIILS